jgi:hypothetical protein
MAVFLVTGPLPAAQAEADVAPGPSTQEPPASAPAEFPKPTWDQAENIRAAAEHLGKLQRQRGAKGAFEFIGACYKTHGLAETYAAPFEACIAQDYMQSKILAMIYSRLPPEQLKSMGSPSPGDLKVSLSRRVAAAYLQYKIPISYAGDFEKLVEQHGFPVFLSMVFPNAKVPVNPVPGGAQDGPSQDSKPKDKP